MRLQFIRSEIAAGLRRNVMMSISLIIVTGVSLLLLGLGLLAQRQVSESKDYWYDRVQISIFLCNKDDQENPNCADGEVTPVQRTQIEGDLRSPELASQVERVYYESKEDAYRRFKEQFKDSVLSDNVTVDQMPSSFRVRLRNPEQHEVIAEVFRDRPGVESVQDQKEVLQGLFSVLNGAKWGAWLIALLMLLTTVLLVAVTTQLAAYTRRREIGIMRLVGASNLFIQLPFILENLIATALGALLASGLLLLFVEVAVQGWLAEKVRIVEYVDHWDALLAVPTLFLVGLAIAGVSSFIALLRYLKV
ncbi:MAG: ABC transporter permease [Actinomycetales bacterium]|nr:ABC transporter permease [Actinomycetales bacterium]